MDGRTNREVRWGIVIIVVVLAMAFGFFHETRAQSESASQRLVVVIPEILRLRVDQSDVEFVHQTMEENYLYPVDNQIQDISVFSNMEREWVLQLRTEANGDLEWSTDGMTWHSATNGHGTVTVGKQTKGWQNHRVYLRLRATRSERTRVHVAYELTAVGDR